MYARSTYWPSSVPESLWQLGLLVPGNHKDFPFVGIVVSAQFIIAFVGGCILICAFAWRRFSEPTYDVNTPAFRDFKGLTIWNLRDSFSLRRAYVIYCMSLIFIYGLLAFFGRLIVQLFEQLQISGLQIGVGTIEFDSWQWPIFLALGISGFAPLINPLIPAENWLRRFSHEVVGIPTRLNEKAVRLKTLIDGAPSSKTQRRTSQWVTKLLGSKLNSCFALEDNLKTVVHWSYQEHVEWSDPEIRRKLNEYERQARDDAEAALADFEYLTDSAKNPDPKTSADHERIKELEARLTNNVVLLEEIRDKFALVMAVYCEFGSRFQKMKDCDLRESIRDKVADRRELPAIGVPLYWFLFVFVFYFLLVKAQWHAPISAVPLSNQTSAITAFLETLKVFLLVWLPTTGVAAFVSVIYGPTQLQSPTRKNLVWATISGALWALGIAVIGMVLVALLFSALPSSNVSQMGQSLFGSSGWMGMLLYFLLLSPIAAISFGFVNFVRAREKTPSFGLVLIMAVAAGASVAAYLGIFVGLTSPGACMVGSVEPKQDPVAVYWWGVAFLREPDLETCFAYYGMLDLILVPLSSFFAVLGLATFRLPSIKKVLVTGCVAGFIVPTGFSPVRAEEVVIGFRTDIPPFSFLAPPNAQNEDRAYVGYLADLCYEIFDNSDYVVIQRSVDGNGRFTSMRPQEDNISAKKDPDKIDILCDAVTISLDDKERTKAGIFSPIVFVSGVSYISRSVRNFKDVEIGYLGKSTAEAVAKEACTVDALRRGSASARTHCYEAGALDCKVEQPKEEKKNEPTMSLKDRSSKVPSYVLCPMNNHDDLIKWFCSNSGEDKKFGKDKMYFGDREIILGKLDAWMKAGHQCDDVRDPFQSFTYEPYALLVTKSNVKLFAFVQRRIYELFSHRSGAEALFYKWFPEQTMSEPLAWLFSLNAVMEQDRLLGGAKQFPGISPPRNIP